MAATAKLYAMNGSCAMGCLELVNGILVSLTTRPIVRSYIEHLLDPKTKSDTASRRGTFDANYDHYSQAPTYKICEQEQRHGSADKSRLCLPIGYAYRLF